MVRRYFRGELAEARVRRRGLRRHHRDDRRVVCETHEEERLDRQRLPRPQQGFINEAVQEPGRVDRPQRAHRHRGIGQYAGRGQWLPARRDDLLGAAGRLLARRCVQRLRLDGGQRQAVPAVGLVLIRRGSLADAPHKLPFGAEARAQLLPLVCVCCRGRAPGCYTVDPADAWQPCTQIPSCTNATQMADRPLAAEKLPAYSRKAPGTLARFAVREVTVASCELPRASRPWANTLAYRRDATPVVTSVAPRAAPPRAARCSRSWWRAPPASASPANVEVSVVGLPCTVQSVSGGEVVCDGVARARVGRAPRHGRGGARPRRRRRRRRDGQRDLRIRRPLVTADDVGRRRRDDPGRDRRRVGVDSAGAAHPPRRRRPGVHAHRAGDA